jgi:peroxiredoxin
VGVGDRRFEKTMSLQRPPALVLALAATTLAWPLPAVAQRTPGFGTPSARYLAVPEFTDRDVSDLMSSLDAALIGTRPAPSSDDAAYTLWAFVRRLQAGRLTPSQEASVLGHLAALARANADYQNPIERASFMVRALTVGKTAPPTTGEDLGGHPLRLSDYRGKVVVLTFSADWCGICRSQYPYYRLMQELYENWPFAILGVEAGARETVAGLKAQHGLTYRSWWDNPRTEGGRGPIASAWNVHGWPTTYVLDANGVVRFVDLRDEDLLKAVRQLLVEQADRRAETASRDRH